MPRFGFGFGFNNQLGQFVPVIVTQRNFTTLASAGSKHYTIPSISLSTTFVIDMDFATSVTSGINILIGNNTDGNTFIYVDGTTGTVFTRMLTSKNLNSTATVNDGKLHNIRYVATSGTGELFIDGVSQGTVAGLAISSNFDIIGRNFFVNNFNGVIANVQITDAGVLKRFYRIDETWVGPSTVLVDSGSDGSNGTAVNITTADSQTFTKSLNDWLGVDIWTHGDISAISAASGFVGGVSVTAVSGLRYKFFYDVANFVEGSTTAIVGAAGASRTANGTFTDIITATSTSAGWDVATNPTTLDVNNGEIKRILEGA